MSNGLTTALQPAFDYLLATLGERYEVFFRLCAWKDELYFVLLAFIERHYLAVYDAYFSENFYALKRMKSAGPKGSLAPLGARDKLLSLLLVTIFPYLRMKLVKTHQVLAQEAEQDAQQAAATQRRQAVGSANAQQAQNTLPQSSLGEVPSAGSIASSPRLAPNVNQQYELYAGRSKLYYKLREAFLRSVPLGLAGYELWAFYLKVLFMFQRTEHFSPPQWLQGIVLARVTGDDMRAQMLAEEVRDKTRGLIGKATSKAISFLRTALVASALLFKLLEWYYSPENQSQRESAKGMQIMPPPPMPPQCASAGVGLPRDPRQCPLCHERRVNPAVSSSGLAFCFICIHRFVLEHGRCPVTDTPCQVSQIRRIFES